MKIQYKNTKNDLDLNVICIAHILVPCPERSQVNQEKPDTHNSSVENRGL